MKQFFFEAWESIQDGGVVMIALLALSLLLYRSAFGALFFVKGFSVKRIREGLEGAATQAELEIALSQSKREFGELVARQIAFIGMLAAAAPLLGLLGTVMGMLETFESLTQRAQETATQVSGGVRFALVTTQAGLMVAIPAIFIIQWIKRVANARQQEMEREEFLVARGEEAGAR